MEVSSAQFEGVSVENSPLEGLPQDILSLIFEDELDAFHLLLLFRQPNKPRRRWNRQLAASPDISKNLEESPTTTSLKAATKTNPNPPETPLKKMKLRNDHID